jgi:hypothetical protein
MSSAVHCFWSMVIILPCSDYAILNRRRDARAARSAGLLITRFLATTTAHVWRHQPVDSSPLGYAFSSESSGSDAPRLTASWAS